MPASPANSDEQRRKRDRDALLLLALLSLSDLADADRLWRAHVPRAYAGLLSLADGWRFDATTQTYRSRTGATLPTDGMRGLVLPLIGSVSEELRQDTARLYATRPGNAPGPHAETPAGPETPVVAPAALARWEHAVAMTARDLYLAVTAAGLGGIPNVTPDDLRRLAGDAANPVPPDATEPPTLAFTLDRLGNFAGAIEAGEESEAAAVNRVGLYGDFGHTVWQDAVREGHKRARDAKGRRMFMYERSILDPESHDACHDGEYTEGCVETAAAGWKPIGSLPLCGCRTCGPRCRCKMSYILVPPDALNPN